MTAEPFNPTNPALQTDLGRARRLANLMDAQFKVLGFRFGLDPLVGLLPVIGDALTLLAGVYPIVLARKHGLGTRVAVRMGTNLCIDFAGGLIPVIGDLFDANYRANLKNLALLEKAIERGSR